MRTRNAVVTLTIAASAWVIASRALLAADEPNAAATSNLLQNPSFEERSGAAKEGEPWGKGDLDGVARSPFAHWGYSGFWDNGDYDIKLGPGRTGKTCVRLVCRENGRGGIASEAVRVPAGTKLRFTGWFKAVGAKGGACCVNFEGEPGDGWANIPLPAKSDYPWTEVTGTVTVPKPRKSSGELVEIYVFVYTRAFGELWIDDLSLMLMKDEGVAGH
jgi:hypothetical protein